MARTILVLRHPFKPIGQLKIAYYRPCFHGSTLSWINSRGSFVSVASDMGLPAIQFVPSNQELAMPRRPGPSSFRKVLRHFPFNSRGPANGISPQRTHYKRPRFIAFVMSSSRLTAQSLRACRGAMQSNTCARHNREARTYFRTFL